MVPSRNSLSADISNPPDTLNVADTSKIGSEDDQMLVIRLSAMGDVAMTVPVLLALTQQYPQLKITVLTKPFFNPIFERLKNVDVYEAEIKARHRGIGGLWKLYRELRKRNFHAVADLHNVLRSKILRAFFRLTNIPFEQIDKGRKEKRALTAGKDKAFIPLKPTVERYASVFADLGYSIDLSKVRLLPNEKIPTAVAEMIGDKEGKWLGVAPFAAFKGKMYPLDKMQEVLQRLNKTNRYKILLFGGGPDELAQLEALEEQIESCVNCAGKLSFTEELALISNLDAMLAMDSGNAHLAAMYGIPVIGLWGVTHPYAGFYPFGQPMENALMADREKFPLIPTSIYGNKMPEGYEKAMETISPTTVVDKIREILKK